MYDTSIRELILRLDATIDGMRRDVQDVATHVSAVENNLNNVGHDLYHI